MNPNGNKTTQNDVKINKQNNIFINLFTYIKKK